MDASPSRDLALYRLTLDQFAELFGREIELTTEQPKRPGARKRAMMRVAIHNAEAQAYTAELLSRIATLRLWDEECALVDELRAFSSGLADRLEEEGFYLAGHLPTFGYIPFGNMDSWLN